MKGKWKDQGRTDGRHGEGVRRKETEAEGRSKAEAGEPDGDDRNQREG